MGCKSGVFSSNLHHAGWGYNSCTGGAVDEADADADVASVWCWLYATDAARANVMQKGLLILVLLWFSAEGILDDDPPLLQEIMILVVLPSSGGCSNGFGCVLIQLWNHHKRHSKMPPKSISTGRQIPLAPVDSVRVGNGPWRVKSKPFPRRVLTVLESNSFAALQCPKADTILDPSDGVMKKDALGFSEPDLSSTLSGEEANLRILTHSELEWENQGEPPLEIEGLP
ncbi:hypothetical protein Nepgr_007937 [Nepenthes gracilis]|uniref:Uncharacterized protein n=1 Tax=Nepenthes gracilis TaxID=150966 RepID=A0AAD3S7T8_NEPGR|nr:hypothetical protein Nepgr_007937 [Nepenthes gracilis]